MILCGNTCENSCKICVFTIIYCTDTHSFFCLGKLWVRCIVSEVHDDYDNPSESPAFLSSTSKQAQKESLSEAIGGAAVATVKALKTDPKEKSSDAVSAPGCGPGVSPDLQIKNYQRPRYLQQLYEDNILNENGYAEQKSILAELQNLY